MRAPHDVQLTRLLAEIQAGMRLNEETLDAILASALQARKLEVTVAALLKQELCASDAFDSRRLREAKTALETLAADIEHLHAELTEALHSAGVTAQRLGNEPAAPLFPTLSLRVAQDDATAALDVLGRAGFQPLDALSPGAKEVLRRTSTGIGLMRSDRLGARLSLIWGDGPGPGRTVRRIAPNLGDLLFMPLPRWAWPLYYPLKAPRLALERVRGKRVLDTAGGYQATVNLGTPEALVAPVLDLARLTRGDRFLDVGCGDGRLVKAAAERYGCQATGVERNAELARQARASLAGSPASKRVRIEVGDATPALIQSASCVFLFQPPETVAQLVPFVRTHLAPGARLIIHELSPLPDGLDPDRSVPVFAAGAMTVAHLWKPAG